MSKSSLDYQFLQDTLEKRRYKLADVKDQIVKVAFDVVRFKDGNVDELWKIQNADDGDYIIALYDEDSENVKKEATWKVSLNKLSGDVLFSYKNEMITKIASSKLGIDDYNFIEQQLSQKLSENSGLVKALLKELPVSERNELVKKFPELG